MLIGCYGGGWRAGWMADFGRVARKQKRSVGRQERVLPFSVHLRIVSNDAKWTMSTWINE